MDVPTSPNGIIRITSTPPGEAPESVRQAWIGLELPLASPLGGPRTLHASGVLSGPRSFLGSLLGLATGSVNERTGYPVKVRAAMAILAAHAPEAEAWWRQNVARMFEGDRTFVFAASCAEVVGGAAAARTDDDTRRITAASSTARMLRSMCVLLAIDVGIPLCWSYGILPKGSPRLWIMLIVSLGTTVVLALFLIARLRAVKQRELERQA